MLSSTMGTAMKGIYKGFKYTLSHFFVVKEREIEIGYPTNVKHLAHIGWDGSGGGSAPSWMNQFKTGPDFASSSFTNSVSPWTSQDLGEESKRQHSGWKLHKEKLPELPFIKKKLKLKKLSPTAILGTSGSPRLGKTTAIQVA